MLLNFPQILSISRTRLILALVTATVLVMGTFSFAVTTTSQQLLSNAQRNFNNGQLGWTPQGNTIIALDKHSGMSSSGGLVVKVSEQGLYADSSRTARVGTPQFKEGISASPGNYNGTALLKLMRAQRLSKLTQNGSD